MYFSHSFCTVVEAYVSLLLLLIVSECRRVENRNVLVIVGNTFFQVLTVLRPVLKVSLKCTILSASADLRKRYSKL